VGTLISILDVEKEKPTNNVDCDEKEEKKTIHLVDEIATAIHSHVVAHSMQKAPSCFT
jgi:hypothetical protein